jgi:hypothetical protein
MSQADKLRRMAAHGYFSARPEFDHPEGRTVFDAGFSCAVAAISIAADMDTQAAPPPPSAGEPPAVGINPVMTCPRCLGEAHMGPCS